MSEDIDFGGWLVSLTKESDARGAMVQERWYSDRWEIRVNGILIMVRPDPYETLPFVSHPLTAEVKG